MLNHNIIIALVILVVKIGEIFLETLRVIFIAHNRKIRASMIYFIEVIVWLSCFGYTVSHIKSNPLCVITYALGGAIGTYLGLIVGYTKEK